MLRPHDNSLFAILLRSPWWASALVALGLAGGLRLIIRISSRCSPGCRSPRSRPMSAGTARAEREEGGAHARARAHDAVAGVRRRDGSGVSARGLHGEPAFGEGGLRAGAGLAQHGSWAASAGRRRARVSRAAARARRGAARARRTAASTSRPARSPRRPRRSRPRRTSASCRARSSRECWRKKSVRARFPG